MLEHGPEIFLAFFCFSRFKGGIGEGKWATQIPKLSWEPSRRFPFIYIGQDRARKEEHCLHSHLITDSYETTLVESWLAKHWCGPIFRGRFLEGWSCQV
jgi:hypothetical protein